MDDIIILNFGEARLPEFKEVRSKGWVLMDSEDNYPDRLTDMFNHSPKHNAIIGAKAGYIFGKGLKAKEETERELAWQSGVNRYGQTLDNLTKKSCIDVELFGGFYWQIIPMPTGFELYNIDWRKVRKGKDGGFFYKKDGKWTDKKEPAVYYPAFSKDEKVSSIYHYYEYRPGMDEYPLPGYIASATYIEADIAVSEHVLSNAQGGFSASKFINFFNGEPEEDKKKAIERTFTKKFTGSNGKKIILGFNNDPAKRPTIDDLGTSDLTKENFTVVDKLIEQNIFAGHRITSPVLFGIKTEGQLGGSTELKEAYEIFKSTYANEKQQNLEEVINRFAKLKGLSDFNFIQNDPIDIIFSESTILAVAPKGYILDKLGIDPTEYAPDPAAPDPSQAMANENVRNLTGRQHQQLMRIIRQYSKGQLTLEAASALLRSGLGLGEEEITAMLGVNETFKKQGNDDEMLAYFATIGEPKNDFITVRSRPVYFSSDEEMFNDELNTFQASFAEVSALDTRILEILKNDKRATAEVIANALKVSVEVVNNKLNELQKGGLLKRTLIKENNTDVEVRELEKPIAEISKPKDRVEIHIRYSYEGPEDYRNREFCALLMEMDKFYSRVEIEKMSEHLGYSVWDRRGGFWNDGGTVKPFCRHTWKSNVVLKKRKAK